VFCAANRSSSCGSPGIVMVMITDMPILLGRRVGGI
jgi:hypothetical protein